MHVSNPRFDDTRHRRPGGSVPGRPSATMGRSAPSARSGLARRSQVQRRPDPTGPPDPVDRSETHRFSAPPHSTQLLHGRRWRRRDALTGIWIPSGKPCARTHRDLLTRGAGALQPTRFSLRCHPGRGRRQNEQDQRDQELDAMAIHALHAPSTTGEKTTRPRRTRGSASDGTLLVQKGTFFQRRRKYPPVVRETSTALLGRPGGRAPSGTVAPARATRL